jgi:hypothetical protein
MTWRRRVLGILVAVSVVAAFHLLRGTTTPRATGMVAVGCAVIFVVYEYLMWRADLPNKS